MIQQIVETKTIQELDSITSKILKKKERQSANCTYYTEVAPINICIQCPVCGELILWEPPDEFPLQCYHEGKCKTSWQANDIGRNVPFRVIKYGNKNETK